MARHTQPVEIEELGKPFDGHRVKHPCFGQITVSRTHGNSVLYGSDFVHQHSIRVCISRSYLDRHLSRDWPHGNDELIEIEMSEAQWAMFVSSFNQGGGTQCTLRRFNHEMIPSLPHPVNSHKKFKAELDDDMRESIEAIEAAIAEIDSLGLSKKKVDAVRGKMTKARDRLQAGMPFVLEQFKEHMEETVEKAKIEVNAHITTAVQRAGLEAIAEKNMLRLESIAESEAVIVENGE